MSSLTEPCSSSRARSFSVCALAIDLLPPNFPARVYPVGQLDAESKGLLLLTNDGELTNQLTHPRYGVPKTYRAVIDGYITPNVLDELKGGMWMADPKKGTGFKTGRSHIKIVRRCDTFSCKLLVFLTCPRRSAGMVMDDNNMGAASGNGRTKQFSRIHH